MRARTHVAAGFLALFLGLTPSALATTASPSPSPSPSEDPAPAIVYESDVDPDVVPMFKGVEMLDDDVLAASMDYVIRANTYASDTRISQALADAKASSSESVYVVNGLGKDLAGYYQRGSEGGSLPLTTGLIAQVNLGEGEGVTPAWDSLGKVAETYQIASPLTTHAEQLNALGDGEQAEFSFTSHGAFLAYEEALVLATMLPEVGPQIIASGADVAESQIVLGVSSPIDVIGARALATRTVAARWSDEDFRVSLYAARDELRSYLAQYCEAELGNADLASCLTSQVDSGRNASTDQAVAASRFALTYGLPATGDTTVTVTIPPGAENLILTAFPDLSASQRRAILEQTALKSGYPLDLSGKLARGGDVGWTRLDLAVAMASLPQVNADGSVTVSRHELEIEIGDPTQNPEPDANGWSIGAVFDQPALWTVLVGFGAIGAVVLVSVRRRRKP